MSLPAELLQTVTSRPNDDLPRREAAEWCRLNGHAERANFIVMQLKLAKLVRMDPDDDDAFDLALDTETLLESYGNQWLEFDGLNELVDDYSYNRGFVELVEMPAARFMQQVDLLYRLSPIYHLDLTKVIDVAEGLFQLPQLQQLLSLSMDQCGLKDEHLEQFAHSPHFPNLRWLSLILNDIGISGTERLAASTLFPNLQYVNFLGNRVDPIDELLDDQGIVMERRSPSEAREIEARHGPIKWFHPEARLVSDLPPSRFTLLNRTLPEDS
jgi:hypothetical protein